MGSFTVLGYTGRKPPELRALKPFSSFKGPKERGSGKDAFATLHSGAVGLQRSPEAQSQVRKVGHSATGVLELERILPPKATGCL